MFYTDGILTRSDLLDLPHIAHGFSGKSGGVSTHPYTASLNLAKGREDEDAVVEENIRIFAEAVSHGVFGAEHTVCQPQIHSAIVHNVGASHRGNGVLRPSPTEGDGFVTDEPGVLLLVRVADCTPIVLAGQKPDGSPVIGAVHAGWRGTARGIAPEVVRRMEDLGCVVETIRCAVGPHIGACCYEVGVDLFDEVVSLRGVEFGKRHIKPSDESHFMCDMAGMNRELLLSSGVREENIDLSPDCTFCRSEKYYSHRKTAGKRGAMGGGIVILP